MRMRAEASRITVGEIFFAQYEQRDREASVMSGEQGEAYLYALWYSRL